MRWPDNRVTREFAATLRAMRAARDPRLDPLLHLAVRSGWTLAALGAELGITREAVRQRVRRAGPHHRADLPHIPPPPRRPTPIPRPRRTLRVRPEVAAWLREMQDVARTVNGATPADDPRRQVTEDLAAALAALVGQGVSIRELARQMGVNPRAVTSRLERHGHRQPPPSTRGVAYHGRSNREHHLRDARAQWDALVDAPTLDVDAILEVAARMPTVERARRLGRLLRELPFGPRTHPLRPRLRTAFADAVYELTRRYRYADVMGLADLTWTEVMGAVSWHNRGHWTPVR